jgi:hypothetical protein
MKKSLVVSLFSVLSIISFAQERDAGQAVVPIGWENEDSIRFGIFDIKASTEYSSPARAQAEALADSLQGTWEESYSSIPYNALYTGLRRGYMHHAGRLADWKPDFTDIAYGNKQRIYYPSPKRLKFRFDDGYFWRYIDTGFTWFENRYDSNDISPYIEFPKRSSMVIDTFHSFRNAGADSVFTYGKEGRVILGYQDNRLADQLLKTQGGYFFPTEYGVMRDTANLFTARLEFHLDIEDTLNIDTANSLGVLRKNLPLLRVQISFKDSGRAVLPFVPFKRIVDSTSGWYIIADTFITYNTYQALHDSWRVQDTLSNGNPARDWKFKQLQIPLLDMPSKMRNLITIANIPRDEYGKGNGAKGRINSYQHPDFLVDSDGDLDDIDRSLLEMRVLSTYRAKVRVRSLCYQDTVVDKYLYRRKFTGDTGVHSLNWRGEYGGYDDSVERYAHEWADSLGSRLPREFMVNDDNPWFNSLNASIGGYLEYMLSKHNIHMHIREQESNIEGYDLSYQFRRERLSHDRVPPSMFENQSSFFFSDWYNNRIPELRDKFGPGPLDVFPRDYVIHGRFIDTSLSWPSTLDSMQGLVIGRIQETGDTLKAYKRYTEIYGGQNVLTRAYRTSAKIALNHPPNKRFAVELAPQGWGYWKRLINTSTNYPHYDQRPTTPEETQVQLYAGIANGATAFNYCQAFEGGSGNGHFHAAPGAFGIAFDSTNSIDFAWTTDYNFGRKRAKWQIEWVYPNNNEIDTGMAPYYIGYSNHYRSWKRAISRINQIYSTNSYNHYPFNRFYWIDAYSANKALGNYGSDTIYDRTSWRNAFLKCVSTTPVKRWERVSTGSHLAYIDSLVADSAHKTYVEVGLFRDSTSAVDGYAAMVVNTRLWPSLRDAEDSIYYNQGLDSVKDRSRSTLGDIDTRKVWFKIDTTAFPEKFRSHYYVIRDVWHQDTSYLVHCDSTFGIYLKPGEARLLYIEKDIAIKAAPTSTTNVFEFNNGRRIAERKGTLRNVITYTRGGNLYVSYPAKGGQFEGYNERSGGDNIATGWEIQVDTGLFYTPSISVARNDTAVAITYFSMDSAKCGRVRFAYQPHSDSAWKKIVYTGKMFKDSAGDGSDVTPVLTPVNDTAWVIAATYMGAPGKLPGIPSILGFRISTVPGRQLNVVDATPQVIYSGSPLDTGDTHPKFPTLSSRPLPDSMWPVRIAWQRQGKILYRRFKWDTAPLSLENVYDLSDGLPSSCYNRHPCIATGSAVLKVFGFPFFAFITDVVVWESQLFAPSSGTQYWPISRANTQFPTAIVNQWGDFKAYIPDTASTGFHYPVVTTENVGREITAAPPNIASAFVTEGNRIAWHNINRQSVEFVNYLDQSYKTRLKELASWPSLPVKTDTLFENVSYDAQLLKSLTFKTEQLSTPTGDIKVTNGWFPFIAAPKRIIPEPGFVVYLDTNFEFHCGGLFYKDKKKYVSVVDPLGDTTSVKAWRDVSLVDYGYVGTRWEMPDVKPLAVRSDDIIIHGDDSLIVQREVDTMDLAGLRSHFANGSDHIIHRMLLYKSSDSTYMMTIDTGYITSSTVQMPGYGLDAYAARVKISHAISTDTVFVVHQLLRADTTNSLLRSYVSVYSESEVEEPTYKRAFPAPQQQKVGSSLQVLIKPNPTTETATISIITERSSMLNVELYDINGKRLDILFNGEALAGETKLLLDGSRLSAGSYFVRIQYGNELVTRRVELVK